MTGLFEGWHIFVLLLVVLVLFGSKKMPDAARSLGRSMRIFKAETSGLRDNNSDAAAADAQPRPQAVAPQPLPAPQPTVNSATVGTPEAQHSNPSN